MEQGDGEMEYLCTTIERLTRLLVIKPVRLKKA
jgi:hypothetical protein